MPPSLLSTYVWVCHTASPKRKAASKGARSCRRCSPLASRRPSRHRRRSATRASLCGPSWMTFMLPLSQSASRTCPPRLQHHLLAHARIRLHEAKTRVWNLAGALPSDLPPNTGDARAWVGDRNLAPDQPGPKSWELLSVRMTTSLPSPPSPASRLAAVVVLCGPEGSVLASHAAPGICLPSLLRLTTAPCSSAMPPCSCRALRLQRCRPPRPSVRNLLSARQRKPYSQPWTHAVLRFWNPRQVLLHRVFSLCGLQRRSFIWTLRPCAS